MRANKELTGSYEFYLSDLDTHIQVEDLEDKIVVRATRNNVSERRKIHFIRQLAKEGFIPDAYQNFSGFNSMPWLQARWIVDITWLKLSEVVAARARKFMIGLIASSIALWSIMIVILLLR